MQNTSSEKSMGIGKASRVNTVFALFADLMKRMRRSLHSQLRMEKFHMNTILLSGPLLQIDPISW